MQLAEFITTHASALGRNEARHNLILGILERLAGVENSRLRTWTLGGAGACALETPGRPIVLGELSQGQCRALADAVRDLDYAGVVGPDATPLWFVERATEFGHAFAEPTPQRIHALSDPPTYPGSPGSPRQALPSDAALLLGWMAAFTREAGTDDPALSLDAMAKEAAGYTLWLVDGEPVAMAAISRRSRHTAAISGVYTSPAHRQRGYGGSVTAAVAERIFSEGRKSACLYTDLRNPYSNRCYAKIGFQPVCDSLHYHRLGRATG